MTKSVLPFVKTPIWPQVLYPVLILVPSCLKTKLQVLC